MFSIIYDAMQNKAMYNHRYFTVLGYLRSLAIDLSLERFSFLHNEQAAFFELAAKGEVAAEEVPENMQHYFVYTNLDAAHFQAYALDMGLLLDWEADITWIDEERFLHVLPQNPETPHFIYAAKSVNLDKTQAVKENSFYIVLENTTKENAFERIFNQHSNVTLSKMLVHADVVKLTHNGYNPFFYGKKYSINDIENKLLEPFWHSAKTKTDICQNCEFRYMCIDNRLPTQRQTDGLWYHTVECNYNPYIAKWKGEEGYRTLAQCGVKSDETGFSIDHERIAKINEELWGED